MQAQIADPGHVAFQQRHVEAVLGLHELGARVDLLEQRGNRDAVGKRDRRRFGITKLGAFPTRETVAQVGKRGDFNRNIFEIGAAPGKLPGDDRIDFETGPLGMNAEFDTPSGKRTL